jgi:trigger factor|tara:strand:+ start:1004 stop:2335 length:1332 start_codon:yes stop_codon:yes gene_type:complete
MNIRLEKKEKCLAALSVEVPAEKVTEERNKVLKGFVTQARIPGFRPGKAPLSVIEKAHSSDITQEVESRLIQNSFQEALKENNDLKVLSVKNPKNVTHQADGSFTFEAEIITAPEISLPEYKGLEIEVPKSEITDEAVDQNLEQLRQRFADYEDITDRATELGDLAIIDYTATIDGKPLDEVGGEQAKSLASNEGYWIRIEDEAFFPGFTDALIGSKPNDDKEITITLPDDFPIESIRGMEAVFAVTVTGLKNESLPELDDEFAGKIEAGKSLDDIKALIRDDLDLRQKRQLEEIKINSVLAKLNALTDFDVPEEFLQSETQGQADAMVSEGLEAGMSEDEVEERKAGLFEEAQVRAKNSLKTNFLLTEIGEKEELKVENSEVLQRVTVMAKQAKKPVKGYMKELQKNGQLGNIRQNMIFSKAIDFLVEHANVTEVEPETEEK